MEDWVWWNYIHCQQWNYTWSYRLPLTTGISYYWKKDRILQHQTKDILNLNPELFTFHTVLVVDTSGSMTKHDINFHWDRQVAAYSITAMEFLAEQIFKQTVTNSDVVSII